MIERIPLIVAPTRDQQRAIARLQADMRRAPPNERRGMGLMFRRLLGQSAGSGGGVNIPPDTNLGSDLLAWYKKGTGIYDAVSGGSLVSADGTQVGRWEDASGNGYHSTRNTAIGVGDTKWSTSVTDRGSGTVFFNNTSASFSFEPFRSVIQAGHACEMWIRLKNLSDAGGNGAWFLGGTNTTHFLYSDGHWYESFFSSNRRDLGNPTPDTSAAFVVVDVYSLTDEWEAFLNNTSLRHDSGAGSNTVDTGSTGYKIGEQGGYKLGAHVSEIVFSKAKATATQRNNMYAYLTA
jgi:hypothetical protein